MTISSTQRSLLAVAGAVGIATGLGAVPNASAAHAAPQTYPLCYSWTDYSLPDGDVVHLPSVTRNGHDLNCTFVRGMDSGGVFKLQDALNRCYGANLVVDGYFGPETEAALRRIGPLHGLPGDGIYGPPLRRAMLWPIYNSDGSFDRCTQAGYWPVLNR